MHPILLSALALPAREYGIFMGLQYYGPALNQSTYTRVAAASRRVPLYVSVCADHNDTSGGAEHRKPGGDPADGGRIVPICDLGDDEGAAVRARIATLREAGAHVLHYTHTRIAYFPNGTEQRCCECCEDLPYVISRVDNETRNFPADGIFTDNVVANDAWLPYYKAIVKKARREDPTRKHAFNQNCAHDSSERCSPFCEQYGHDAEACKNCKSDRCTHMSHEWLGLADVHLLSEATVGAHDLFPDFKMNLPFEPTDADKSKFSMFTYNATPTSWRPLIDAARAQGFSKFWVDGRGGDNRTSFLALPPWFEEMVEYIRGFNNEQE